MIVCAVKNETGTDINNKIGLVPKYMSKICPIVTKIAIERILVMNANLCIFMDDVCHSSDLMVLLIEVFI
jgi:hypothetical protein